MFAGNILKNCFDNSWRAALDPLAGLMRPIKGLIPFCASPLSGAHCILTNWKLSLSPSLPLSLSPSLKKNYPFLFSVLKFIYIGEGPREEEDNFQEFTNLAKNLKVKGIGQDESFGGIFIALSVSSLGKVICLFVCLSLSQLVFLLDIHTLLCIDYLCYSCSCAFNYHSK